MAENKARRLIVLKEFEREIMHLCVCSNLSILQIAERMKLKPTSIRKILSMAVSKMIELKKENDSQPKPIGGADI